MQIKTWLASSNANCMSWTTIDSLLFGSKGKKGSLQNLKKMSLKCKYRKYIYRMGKEWLWIKELMNDVEHDL